MLAVLWNSDNLGHTEKILFYQVSLKDLEGQSNILCPFLWIVSELTTLVTQKSIFIIPIDMSLQNSKKEKSTVYCPAMMRLWVWSHLQVCLDASKIITVVSASLPGTDSGTPTQVNQCIIPFRWQLSWGGFDLKYPGEKGKTFIPWLGTACFLLPKDKETRLSQFGLGSL